MDILSLIKEPWPWYIAGPLIGLMVPLLLLLGNKQFGISSNLRHMCAACIPSDINYFQYNWKGEIWNMVMIAGVLIGGLLAYYTTGPLHAHISQATQQDLSALGLEPVSGLIPAEIFNWSNLLTAEGLLFMVAGGFMVGFGARYAGGCTSGHAIMGLSNLQKSSLYAVIGFFIGGLTITHLLLPLILG